MAYYFDRVCKVIIENKSKIVIDDSKIKFEITKSIEAKENTAKIEIYNLASETRKRITSEDSLIRIFAGYVNNENLIEIGQGDITRIKTNRSKTEVVTEIYMAEGLKKIKRNPVSLSYSKNVKLSEVLSSLTTQTGFSFRIVDMDNNNSLQGGYADIGSLDTVLHNLSLKYIFDWSVQNGVILIRGTKSTSKNEIMLLTAESGLILHPESVKKLSRRLDKSNITKEENRNSCTALLQAQLQVNDIIAIESQDLKGKFRIEKIVHTGDTRGNDWYSNMEIVGT